MSNFPPLEVVDRGSETQPQVVEFIFLARWGLTLIQFHLFVLIQRSESLAEMIESVDVKGDIEQIATSRLGGQGFTEQIMLDFYVSLLFCIPLTWYHNV